VRESNSSHLALINASDVAGENTSGAAIGLGAGAGTIVSPLKIEGGGEVGERNDGEKGTGESGKFDDDDDDDIDVADDDGGATKDSLRGVLAGPPTTADEGPDDDVDALGEASEREVPAASRALGAATTATAGVDATQELEAG